MNIIEYFQKLTKLKPIPEQCSLLTTLVDLNVKNQAVSCGRGFGKTLACAVATIYFTSELSKEIGRPINILLISSQAEMYDCIDRIFRDNPELTKRLRIQGITREIPSEEFEFEDTHSRVSRHKTTSKSIRSHRADIVLLDEAAGIPKEVIIIAQGCLTGDINKIVLISTPYKNSYFNEIVNEPKKHGFTLNTYSSEICPWQALTVERSKKNMTPQEYASEIIGRPPLKSEMQLFTNTHIDACCKTEVLKEGGPNSSLEAGLDFGFDPCATVLCITEKIGVRRKLLFLKVWYKNPIEVIAPEIGETLNKFDVNVIKADSHPPEYHGHIEKYTNKKINYIFTRGVKEVMIGQLKRKIAQHTLEIPENRKDLILQLRKYRMGMRTGDDLVDSLAFSIYEPDIPLQGGKPQVVVYFRPCKNHKA